MNEKKPRCTGLHGEKNCGSVMMYLPCLFKRPVLLPPPRSIVKYLSQHIVKGHQVTAANPPRSRKDVKLACNISGILLRRASIARTISTYDTFIDLVSPTMTLPCCTFQQVHIMTISAILHNPCHFRLTPYNCGPTRAALSSSTTSHPSDIQRRTCTQNQVANLEERLTNSFHGVQKTYPRLSESSHR
ncbi:hypothetical protein BDV39DRAFT_146639 [Aspergillus sergii]|uniref:Uncharacterized protein n=1 Tax=Aspergillus sergii TaxID=1034303 RepID=A0A5N6WPW1_9EURO|nr:hypothetical protein BDV39DRAFT_146639 [Aspergillus sergii]